MNWQQLLQDKIYFDDVTGVPGTAWPIGTPSVPSDVIADVITICTARNIRIIHVHGALTLTDTMEHYCFCGAEHEDVADIVSLNGQDVDGSHMEGLLVTGAQGGAGFLALIRCIANTLTNFQGQMNRCSFYAGTCSFKNAGYVDLIDCESIYGVVTITVQAPTRASIKNWRGNLILTAQSGGACYVRGFKGYLEIDLMTGGTLDIFANGADIQINNDCTVGTINIFGNARIVNNTGGTAVNNYTLEGRTKGLDDIHDDLAGVVTGADPKVMGRLQIASASWDGRLGDGPGSDLLLTATDQAVVVESVIIVMAAAPDLTNDPWTGISVEDDYGTTPHIFIPAADALKAALTANAQLAWTGSVYLAVGRAIQATAIGDDADADASITVIVLYRAVVSGGYLA